MNSGDIFEAKFGLFIRDLSADLGEDISPAALRVLIQDSMHGAQVGELGNVGSGHKTAFIAGVVINVLFAMFQSELDTLDDKLVDLANSLFGDSSATQETFIAEMQRQLPEDYDRDQVHLIIQTVINERRNDGAGPTVETTY